MSEARGFESERIQAARAYLNAGYAGDYETCAGLMGESFVWIDHSQGVVADTPETLARATAERSGFAERVYEIDRIMETVDGAVVTQGTVSQTHMGTFRGVPPTSRRVSIRCCEIIGFDSKGRIISEEAYTDDLGMMQQLGITDITNVT